MDAGRPLPPIPGLDGIPDELINHLRKRSNRKEDSRFPYKVFALLKWVGYDQNRANLAGCGWVSDSQNEFYIHKPRLCEVLNVKLNTLNVNLKTLGFEQTRKVGEHSYFKNDIFSKNSSQQDFERIRNSRCKPDSLMHMNAKAAYFPLLEHIQLFMMDEKAISMFKKEVIQKWEKLVGSPLIFAVSIPVFTKYLLNSIQDSLGYHDENNTIQQVLVGKTPNVVTIFDFAVFLARFGPFDNVPYKIMQYQQILHIIQPDYFMFTAPSLINYFSSTFHNCFSFKISQTGEYHCYNLPLISSSAAYLVDEDGVYYKSWEKMVEANHFLTQRG
ncbi:hypothetical protein TVAG_346240 [Trichomonas vaginalis G3]|uniref:Initiator binding domain-containing protein n=1 Tax=Trichomonas vaginalis (strain ATCC PRA-98 / G3) TaxID=412133 RepID=A2FK14_TRIV3|nr:Initiator binding protein 39 kDa family [Trichomonas vaginalis G3]EAX94761.1 hypothetical protein TVAG_346240 [Trichomonas vaginalis G3]KAI5491993.1 Initiator binding protein 39 kDa family [Trichomonas vaginalis G3]|eukprot:XP_001307691.1 hypothetical protein [Trichomonas vaginalis G3]